MNHRNPLTHRYPLHRHDNTGRYCLGYRYVINITTGRWSCQCGAQGEGDPHPHPRGHIDIEVGDLL